MTTHVKVALMTEQNSLKVALMTGQNSLFTVNQIGDPPGKHAEHRQTVISFMDLPIAVDGQRISLLKKPLFVTKLILSLPIYYFDSLGNFQKPFLSGNQIIPTGIPAYNAGVLISQIETNEQAHS